MPITHSSHIERWLGREETESLSRSMRGWYGPPIAIAGVPGNVLAGGDGDFTGTIRAGFEASALDRAWDVAKRLRRGVHVATGPDARNQLNVGFATLAALITNATGGSRQDLQFFKNGTGGIGVGWSNSVYRVGTSPIAGVAPAAPAAGTAFTSASTGAILYQNPPSGVNLYFINGGVRASISGPTLLLYDLLFGCAKTASSTATEAVTGVPTRYQNTTANTADSIAGNFLFVQVGGGTISATAHNWTVCQYTNQAGTTGQSFPSMAGNSGSTFDVLDHPKGSWFVPLATGDTGVKALTQMQCDSIIAGNIWFMIGHPIAWLPCPAANMVCAIDGVNTSFNLAQIFNNAFLSFLEVNKPLTTPTTYNGFFSAVSG